MVVIGAGVERAPPAPTWRSPSTRCAASCSPGARPRAAASVVAALTGTRANDLYRGLTGRDPRE